MRDLRRGILLGSLRWAPPTCQWGGVRYHTSSRLTFMNTGTDGRWERSAFPHRNGQCDGCSTSKRFWEERWNPEAKTKILGGKVKTPRQRRGFSLSQTWPTRSAVLSLLPCLVPCPHPLLSPLAAFLLYLNRNDSPPSFQLPVYVIDFLSLLLKLLSQRSKLTS